MGTGGKFLWEYYKMFLCTARSLIWFEASIDK